MQHKPSRGGHGPGHLRDVLLEYQVKKLLGEGGGWCSVLVGAGEVICREQLYVT